MCLFVFYQIYVFNYVPAGNKTTTSPLTCESRQGQGEQLLSLLPDSISLPRPHHSPPAFGLHLTRSILCAVTQVDSTGMFTVQRHSLLLGVCTCCTCRKIFFFLIIYSSRSTSQDGKSYIRLIKRKKKSTFAGKKGEERKMSIPAAFQQAAASTGEDGFRGRPDGGRKAAIKQTQAHKLGTDSRICSLHTESSHCG